MQGNEGDITAFWAGNGFMIDVLAPAFGALLLFPEQRYYGKSLPFGDESFLAENLKFLSTEQVLWGLRSVRVHWGATAFGRLRSAREATWTRTLAVCYNMRGRTTAGAADASQALERSAASRLCRWMGWDWCGARAKAAQRRRGCE